MDDTCTIVRGSTPQVLDGDSLELVSDPAAEVYTGRCKFGRKSAQGGNEGWTHAKAAFVTYAFSVPADSVPPEVGDRVTVTSSRRDAESVGRVFVVSDVPELSTLLVSRKFDAELVPA